MLRKIILFILLIFLDFSLLYSMEERPGSRIPYVAGGGTPRDKRLRRSNSFCLDVESSSSPAVSASRANTYRVSSARVAPMPYTTPLVYQVKETILEFYRNADCVLDLRGATIGFRMKWVDFSFLFKPILELSKDHPIRILDLRDNDLTLDGLPTEVLIDIMHSETLHTIFFDGNPICQSISLDVLLSEFSRLLNSESRAKKILNLIIAEFIKCGEEKLKVEAVFGDFTLEDNMIIFDLGGNRKYKLQKSIVNLPSNFIHRISPLVYKAGILLGTYLIAEVGMYLGTESIDMSQCNIVLLNEYLQRCNFTSIGVVSSVLNSMEG